MTTSICEPPGTSSLPLIVGKNSRGYWTVRDPRGLSGGFFINRTEALHYARLEAGHAPGAVMVSADGLELDLVSASLPWTRTLIDGIKHHAPSVAICAALLSFALILVWQLHDTEPDLILRAILISPAIVLGSMLVLGVAHWLIARMSRLYQPRWPRYGLQRR
jgi:hypothetical protein